MQSSRRLERPVARDLIVRFPAARLVQRRSHEGRLWVGFSRPGEVGPVTAVPGDRRRSGSAQRTAHVGGFLPFPIS
jgi:hypothetical protein